MSTTAPETIEYVCPGEKSPISRAVHLGRLAGFYPACRRCPHRDDTGTLSARRVKHLVDSRRRGQRPPLFREEGVAGAVQSELDATIAKRLGAAMGIRLRHEQPGTGHPPVAVIAGDGRPLSAELLAAAGEGLRWAGCHLVDLGEATAACAAFAIDLLGADGGLLVGNPTGQAHSVGLKFWAAAARPLSAGGELEALRAIYDAKPDRPTRRFGDQERFQAQNPYLAGLAEHYHAMRPLRLVLDTTCPPVAGYLETLTSPVACRVLRCRLRPERLGEQVREDRAHFGVRIDDDAETCRLVDERGRPVDHDRLFLLLARQLAGTRPEVPIVVQEDTPPQVASEIKRSGGSILTSGPRRAEVYQTMRTHKVLLGVGPGGRFWHGTGAGHVSADALVTLTVLFEMLSRSDRPLSEVLDAQAPVR